MIIRKLGLGSKNKNDNNTTIITSTTPVPTICVYILGRSYRDALTSSILRPRLQLVPAGAARLLRNPLPHLSLQAEGWARTLHGSWEMIKDLGFYFSVAKKDEIYV